jgi:protein-tyrosine phosphatase
LVALGYAYIGGSVFQKQENGAHTLASRVLFAPYLVAARVNKWLHLKNNLRKWEFAGLTIRSHPKSFGAHEQSLDLCAEVSGEVAPAAPYVSLPWLDLVPPSPKALTAAMSAIERLQKTGPVSVNCALGVGRSALVAVAWSLHTWQYRSVTDAINAAKSQCPSIALSPESIAMLHRWWTPVL